MENPKGPTPDQQLMQANMQVGGVNFGRDNVVHIERDLIGTLYGYTPEQVGEIVAALRRVEQPRTYNGRPPYPGLLTYQEGDADLFFGREAQVDELVERLKSSRFLCITGPSGCGKSSLARAGVIPRLRAGQIIPGSEKWLIAILVLEANPMENLSQAISALALQTGKDFHAAGDYLRQNGAKEPAALANVIDLLTQGEVTRRVVLVIDQFEQVFSAQPEVQAVFFAQLIHAIQVDGGRLTTILTMRSDFLGQCAVYPAARNLINQGFQLIGAMQAEGLARAITLPALEVGVEIEPELAQQVISDMRGEPGALPLMQFALQDLFNAQDPSPGKSIRLTRQQYLARGGVWSALRRHADAILAALDIQQQAICRQIFTHLVNISQNHEITRRKATYAELEAAAPDPSNLTHVLDRLTEARLIIAEGNAEPGKEGLDSRFFTLAHERLVEAWPWLNRLIDENRQMILLANQIEMDTLQWVEHKHDPSYLYRGAKLETVRHQQTQLTLSPAGSNFLKSSQEQQGFETRQETFNQLRNVALRGMLGGAAGFSLAYLLNVWNQIYGEGLWFLTLLFVTIFWGLIGASAGLITTIGAAQSQFQSGQRPTFTGLLVGGFSGAVGFSLAFLAFALLSSKGSGLPLIILEGGLWGFTTGLGVAWALKAKNRLWVKILTLGLSGGIVFSLGETLGKAYLRPNPPALPAIWQIFLAGALVPVCLWLALSLVKSPDQARSKN